MTDGRKNNGGHSTKGFAGRKSKENQLKLIEQMDAVEIPDTLWRILADKVKEGDTQAIKIWLSYRYGKPKQFTDVTTNGNQVNILPIEWVE
jgi:hypothetical protein